MNFRFQGLFLTEERVARRLAAILAADVVGYSRLVSADEADALSRLSRLRRDIIEPNITTHYGRLFKIMGDGLLAEFASAVQAVSCALAIQAETEAAASGFDDAKKLRLRIGIHVGDVLVEGDDLLGDGVNIAVRLESIASPGGVSISRAVHDQVRDRIQVVFDDKGEITLKNIARPVQVFTLADTKGMLRSPNIETPTLALPDKPSIAVLPFQNMSGDPEQEYFADGMAEDIITGLSRSKSLFVIARNSTFAYKGTAIDLKKVGRDLGVRYVLEGSVRKSGNRVRITGQLIDAATGTHIWADRFDGSLEDVFDLQDKVTESVVGAIPLNVQHAEIERARRKPTESLTAYDLYLRSLAIAHEPNKDVHAEASRLCYKAIELDPQYSAAYGLSAYLLILTKASNWSENPTADKAESIRLARATLKYGGDDAVALARAAFSLAFVGGELEEGLMYVDRALTLDPNLSMAWHSSGWLRLYLGDHETAIAHLDRAVRLSPLDLEVYGMEGARSYAYLFLGQYDQAAKSAERALQRRPQWLPAFRSLAAAKVLSGQLEEAREVAARLLQISSNGLLSRAVSTQPLRRPEDAATLVAALRLAGLSE